MDKSNNARAGWFTLVGFGLTLVSVWSLLQTWFTQDYRWSALAIAGCIGLVILIDRKDKHDEINGTIDRLSIQVVQPKNETGKPIYGVQLRIQEDDHSAKYADFPMPYDVLRTVAKATVNKRPFTVSSWCGEGKMLSRGQFEDLRGWLIKHGYARWEDDRNHTKGVVMTAKGNAFWRGLANTPPSA